MVTHKVVPRLMGELNKELSHVVQLMVIKGSRTHCLSLIVVSSQLGHTIRLQDQGDLGMNTLLHVILPLVQQLHGMPDWFPRGVHVMGKHWLVTLVGARQSKGMIDTCAQRGADTL